MVKRDEAIVKFGCFDCGKEIDLKVDYNELARKPLTLVMDEMAEINKNNKKKTAYFLCKECNNKNNRPNLDFCNICKKKVDLEAGSVLIIEDKKILKSLKDEDGAYDFCSLKCLKEFVNKIGI